MANILDQAGLSDPRGPSNLTQTPQSTVSAAEMVGPMRMLGEALSYNSAKLDEASVPLMQEAGRQAAVTRGPDGSVDVTSKLLPFNTGPGAAAYNSAIMQGGLAMGQNAVTGTLAQMHSEHLGDPAGFKKASDAYLSTLGSTGDPTLRPLLVQDANRLATQHFDNLTSAVAHAGIQNSVTAMQARVQDEQNQMLAMARQDGTGTDAFREAGVRLHDLRTQLAGNPLYGYPQDKADADEKSFSSLAQGEMVVGQVDRTYTKQGRAQAQKVLTDQILNNPDLHLSDPERKQLYGWGMSRLQFLDGEHKAQVDANKETANALIGELSHPGHNIPDARVRDAMDKARALGDAETVEKLYGALRSNGVNGVVAATTGLTDEQRLQRFTATGGAAPGLDPGSSFRITNGAKGTPDAPVTQYVTPDQVKANPSLFADPDGKPLTVGQVSAKISQGASVPVQATQIPGSAAIRQGGSFNDGYRSIPAVGTAMSFFTSKGWTTEQASAIVGNLLHESGMNTGIVGDKTNPQGSAYGVAQWRLERQAGLRSYAAGKGADPSDLQTQLEYVDKELRGSEAGAGTALRGARSVDEANAAMLGFERPRGYTAQNPAGGDGYAARLQNARNIAQAAQGGYLPKGTVAPPVTATGAPTPAGALYPFSQAEMDAHPFVASAYTRAMIEDQHGMVQSATRVADAVEQGLKRDKLPDPSTVASIMQAAEQYPAELGRVRDSMVAGLRGWDGGQQALGMPTAQGAAVVAQAQRAAQGAPIMQQRAAEAMQESYQRGVTAMQQDPNAEGARRGWYNPVAPLDLTNPQTITQTVSGLGMAAQIRTSRIGSPQPVFGPTDLSAVKGAVANGTVEQKMALLQGLAALPDAVRNATLEQIGASGDASVFAYAGGLASVAPEIASSLVQGQAAIQADKRYIPHEGADHKSYLTARDTALPVTAFPPTARMAPGGPVTALNASIDARYAYLSVQAGDVSGKNSPDRLKQAVADVTGGTLDHNGGTVIAPVRGMGQREFDGVLEGVKDSDLAGITTGNGMPIPADYVRRSAKLLAAGDGRYLVQLNSDPNRPLFAQDTNQPARPDGSRAPFVLDLRGRQPDYAGINAALGAIRDAPQSIDIQ